MKVITERGDDARAKGAAIQTAALPPAGTKRWVAHRKAAVVAAVQNGVLSLAEASRRYGLSVEEFAEWERHYQAEGLAGLRVGTRHSPMH